MYNSKYTTPGRGVPAVADVRVSVRTPSILLRASGCERRCLKFDVDKSNPRFAIRVRAQRFPPDMFYVNDFVERLKLYDATVFEELFG